MYSKNSERREICCKDCSEGKNPREPFYQCKVRARKGLRLPNLSQQQRQYVLISETVVLDGSLEQKTTKNKTKWCQDIVESYLSL